MNQNNEVTILWNEGKLISQMLLSENPEIRAHALLLQEQDRIERIVNTAIDEGYVDELIKALQYEKKKTKKDKTGDQKR